MRRTFLTIGLLYLLLAAEPARADESVVLVVNAKSTIADISSIEMRKLYLGFTVYTNDGNPINAIINSGDTHLLNVFLQGVMGMSQRSYDRRLLTLTLQSGRQRPLVAANLDAAIVAVRSNENTLTFAWKKDVEKLEDIRILRVLWQD